MAKLFDMFKQQLFPKFFKSVFKKGKKKEKRNQNLKEPKTKIK